MNVIEPADFFRRIWPEKLLTNETLELRAIDRNTGSIKRQFCTSIRDFLDKSLQYKDLELYFGVATRYGQSTGKKRDCYRVNCVWVDLDDKNINQCVFSHKPDIVVNSGGGWHLYWTLYNPVLVKDDKWTQVESVNRGLCQELDGDNGAIDVTRILRVPGFVNHKYKPNRRVIAYAL